MSDRVAHPEEVLLHGGTTNAGRVVRVGDTVRRPLRPTADATHALLDYLQDTGFDGAPRFLGIDGSGREVLSYIHGEAAIGPASPHLLSEASLVSFAELLRRYHDAVRGFDPTGLRWPPSVPEPFRRAGLISHNDPNLDNVIFREGRAVALIDFDLAGPGSVGWDLACAARLWAPLRMPDDTPTRTRLRSLERLALFAEAYGASEAERTAMLPAFVACHDWCYAIVRRAVSDGHVAFGSWWEAEGRERAVRTRSWLAEHDAELRAALGLRPPTGARDLSQVRSASRASSVARAPRRRID